MPRRFPGFLASHGVEGNDGGFFAAWVDDELTVDDDRRRGDSPGHQFGLVLLHDVLFPDGVAVFELDAVNVAKGADQIDVLVEDEGRGTG